MLRAAPKAEVLDSAGAVLASNTVTSRRGMGGNFFAIQPHTGVSAQASLIAQQVLQQLLNDPKIGRALQLSFFAARVRDVWDRATAAWGERTRNVKLSSR